MPTTTLMPLPKQQFLSALGTPLVGGKVYTYAAGTSNPKATYTDAAGTIAQPNPIQLNVRGEPASPIYWSGNYRVEVRDLLDNLVYSVDNYNTDPAGLWSVMANLAASVGSALLGFIQNAVGAVARTVQDKLREFVSVKDFGAKGDGVTDDTVAWQKALDSGYNIWVPPGTYITSDNLNISGGIIIRGEYRKSIIKRVAGVAVTVVSRTYTDSTNTTFTRNYSDKVVFNLLFPNNSYLVDVIMDGLAFDLPTDATIGVFNAQRVAVSSFCNLYCNTSAYIVNGYDIWQTEWRNIRSQFSKSHFQIDTGTSNVFDRVYCNTKYNTGGNGFTFTNLDYTVMLGCAADSLDRAYYFTGSHCNVTMTGCGSETFSRVIQVSNGARVTVNGGALWLFKNTGTVGSTFYPYQVDTGGVLTMNGTHMGVFDNSIAGATLAGFTVVTGGIVQLNNVRYPIEIGGGTATSWWYVADATSVLMLNDANGARYITARGPSRFDGVSNRKSFEYSKTIAAGSAQSVFRIPSSAYGDSFSAKITVHLINTYIGDMGFSGIMEFFITGFKETTTSQNLTAGSSSFTVSNTGAAGFGGVTGSLLRNGDNTVDFQLNVANAPQVVGNTVVTVFVDYMTNSATNASSTVITGV
jgi:hypothetical protein